MTKTTRTRAAKLSTWALALLALLCFVSSALASASATTTTTTTATRSHIHSQPLSLSLRGGAAKNKNKRKNKNKSKSSVESVRVIKILQCRRFPHGLRLLRSASFLVALVCLFQAYNSIGVPYAQTVWHLLHASSRQQSQTMPYEYVPSAQDRRMAATVAARTGDVLMFPNAAWPSLWNTVWAVLAVVVTSVLHWGCPRFLQEKLVGVTLLDTTTTTNGNTKDTRNKDKDQPDTTNYAARLAQGQRLALVVEHETHTLHPLKTTTTTVRTKTQICRLYPVPAESNHKDKERLYAFDLLPGRRRQCYWNPHTGKVSVPPNP